MSFVAVNMRSPSAVVCDYSTSCIGPLKHRLAHDAMRSAVRPMGKESRFHPGNFMDTYLLLKLLHLLGVILFLGNIIVAPNDDRFGASPR
jgi:hypothetical protein